MNQYTLDSKSAASDGVGQSVARTRSGADPAKDSDASSLGTIAKFVSTDCDAVKRRLRRFYLQSAARELQPSERVAKCLRSPIPIAPTVDVLYSPAGRSAFLAGLQICGSVWMCPVCSAKISERRRVELSAALGAFSERVGGRVVLATFTVSHHVGESLSSSLVPLLDSFRNLRRYRDWRAFSVYHQVVGSIKALELTHGVNGWHPHLHVLFFLGDDLKIIPFEQDLKALWSAALSRSGKWASWSHGVDVRFTDAHVAEYVAKYGKEPNWTVVHEVAKAPSKMGRGSRSPLQLLSDYADGDLTGGELWREYASVLKGRKQLSWSPGLRELLGLVVEQTDEELAKSQDEIAVLLAQLDRPQWRAIVANDARGELLEAAAAGDGAAVLAFLRRLGV